MNFKLTLMIILLFPFFSKITGNVSIAQNSIEENKKKETFQNNCKDSPFTGVAAKGTDLIITKGTQFPLLKPISFIGARATSLVLFPFCATVDIAYYTATKNPRGIKNSTLGLLTSPVGAISPDLVTHHFLPNYNNSNCITTCGKLYHTYAHEIYPESLHDIQAIVIEAKALGKKISIKGAGMSQGKQTLPSNVDDIVLNTSQLKSISIDPNRKIAKVGTGVTWCDLQKEANIYGLAIKVMQASNIFSIGGSLSVNCHGWDHKNGSLRNTILSLTVVDSFGNIQNLTPDDDLFNYFIGGYGGFGVIAEAEILLTDNVNLCEIGEEILPKDYVSYFKKNVLTHPEIDMHLYRLSLAPKQLFKTGIATHYIRVDDTPIIANLKDEPESGSRLDRIKLHVVRRLNWTRNLAWNSEKNVALKPKIASRNEFMRPPINPIFNNSNYDSEWLQEYFVKGEDLSEFLDFLSDILQQNNVAVLNASVRFVKQDNQSKLSYTKDADSFAVVLFFNQNLSKNEIRKTKLWTRKVIDRLIAIDGSYYLPYQQFATIDQFRNCYPDWENVLFQKLSIDPDMLFDNGLYQHYLMPTLAIINENESYFRTSFNEVDGNREQIRDFLQNVFMQLENDKFFALMDSILADKTLDDDEIYKKIYNKINKATPNIVSKTKNAFKSLRALKKDLSQQVSIHLSPQKEVNGYVEIGYTGRLIRPLKKHLSLTAPIYVINEKESLKDYLEVSGTRPYDQFIALQDYKPISEDDIPSSSVDLVACYIGLHHVPPKKLNSFVDSINRVLRPGGVFILMDHDAHTEDMIVFVDVVHSIFNAATGVSPIDNEKEVRNFQSLQEWISFVDSRGFQYNSEKGVLIRKGDSTLNSLIRFDKPINQKELILKEFKQNDEFVRPQLKTYLTAPEWQNVRSAQAYAEFVKEKPSHQYPYFREIKGYWEVFGKSWNVTRNEHSFSETILAENTSMNLFIGTMMTLEYAAKGTLSLPSAYLHSLTNNYGKGNDKPTKSHSEPELAKLNSLKNYGIFIENTPFYKYPYFSDLKNYWKSYSNSIKASNENNGIFRTMFSTRNANNLLGGTTMSLEYGLKGILSIPFALIYGSESLKEAETIHLLVLDPEEIVQSLDSRISIIETFSEEHVKHIEMPRYMVFKDIIIAMSQHPSIQIISVAGHDKIQIDVKFPNYIPNASNLNLLAHKLYDIPMPADTTHYYEAYETNVCKLTELAREFHNSEAEILFIHDY